MLRNVPQLCDPLAGPLVGLAFQRPANSQPLRAKPDARKDMTGKECHANNRHVSRTNDPALIGCRPLATKFVSRDAPGAQRGARPRRPEGVTARGGVFDIRLRRPPRKRMPGTGGRARVTCRRHSCPGTAAVIPRNSAGRADPPPIGAAPARAPQSRTSAATGAKTRSVCVTRERAHRPRGPD